MRPSASGSALALLFLAGLCQAEPVHVRVGAEVVHAGVAAFAATIGGVGNSLIHEGAGFEPVVYRTRYLALEDSPDRVVAAPESISGFDTLREGFLDGAQVRVYRIENGRFRLVREDRVAPGGFHASGWQRAIEAPLAVAPQARRFAYRWEPWSRPGVATWFTVRAVDAAGRLSPPAAALAFRRPAEVGEGTPVNALARLESSGLRGLAVRLGAREPGAPQNLRGRLGADGELALQWDAPAEGSAAGYVVYRSDYPPAQHRGFLLQLQERQAEPIRAGDLVIASKKLYGASRNAWLSNRVWGAASEYGKILPGLVHSFNDETPGRSWRLVPHEAATPVEQPGETCLRLELAAGAREALYAYNHSGTGQDWYEVLEPRSYRVEVWLRQEGPGTARFRLGGFYEQPPHRIEPIVLRAGAQWKKFSATFTPPALQPGRDPGAMLLELSGPGVFFVDNFRVYRADAPYLDLLPEDYAALAAARPSALRTHGLVKTGVHSYDIEQLTNAGGVASGTQRLNTLPQLLGILRKAGVQPWLQIELHLAPREWQALAEYLAAPYDPKRHTAAARPWAYKRYRQGQAKPWAEEFERIYLELSNETWNGLFHPWTFEGMRDAATGKRYSPGEAYGLYQEHVIAVLRASPYWKALEGKLEFVLGGWSGQPYGAEAARASPSSGVMAIGAYLGGWDEGEGPPAAGPDSLRRLLEHTLRTGIPRAERHAREAHGVRLATYEAGPGYAMNGLNGARVSEAQHRAQEQVMKSLAAGTATLDAFLARAYRGYAPQNFFTFGRGELWTSHARWHAGGHAYPSWKALALFNREGAGDMLRTESSGEAVAVYATRRADRLNVFLLSREAQAATPVEVELPIGGAHSITLHRMAGAPDAHNIAADDVRIEAVPLSPAQSGRLLRAVVPPAATLLYVFERTRP